MPYDIIVGRDASDLKKFGKKGLVYLGKGYVKMGQYTSLSNPIYMDVARSHVVLVAGKRGSGKSYTLGVVAEELACLPEEVKDNIASIIFDTMGIYWTMKYPNDKEKELLAENGLKPKRTPCQVLVPFGFYDDYVKRGIPADAMFSLDPSEIKIEDWLLTFNLKLTEPVAVIIERVIGRLKDLGNFDIDDVIEEIREDRETEQNVKNAAIGLFEAAKGWKIFASKNEKATETSDMVKAGITTILDLSMYSSVGAFNVRALVVGLVIRKIFTERMMARKTEEIQAVEHGFEYLAFKTKREMPLVWFFIDEVHEFIPEDAKTPATDAIVQLLREGRQPGMSLAMATQQPGGLRKDALTQADIVLSHRVTAQPDINSLNYIMQSYLAGSVKRYMDELPSLKGSAIILDDNSERIYPMRVRPRFTWHGGESPVAIKVEKKI
ncbi:MAG: DUF87 domain-containing protein [Candidatus Pacearchaeota archaeon]